MASNSTGFSLSRTWLRVHSIMQAARKLKEKSSGIFPGWKAPLSCSTPVAPTNASGWISRSALISALKIENRVFFNPFGDRAVNDDALNLLYNACDVGINTSMGEGWGLVSFEHGATAAAQIVPDHSACRELWGESGELIPIERSFKPEFSVLELGEVSTASVAEAIDRLYHNQRRCQTLGQKAFAASQNPEYSWDRIAQQFESLFLEKVGVMSDVNDHSLL